MSKLTILYADDNPRNHDFLRLALRSENVQLLEVNDGQAAIDTALRERPDLILMDINMPEVNGLDATRRLKAMPDMAHTPIIALTANAMPGDRESCLAAGCDAYLIKPIIRHELLKTIHQFTNPPPHTSPD